MTGVAFSLVEFILGSEFNRMRNHPIKIKISRNIKLVIIGESEFVIDGNNFKTLEVFYDEVQEVLTDNFTGFDRNLDAFDDILLGRFGKFEYKEPIKIAWKNSHKSRIDLGFPETIKYFKKIKLKRCLSIK
ncbi:MAG: barstar family protein [Promethearchaeota archaeon]